MLRIILFRNPPLSSYTSIPVWTKKKTKKRFLLNCFRQVHLGYIVFSFQHYDFFQLILQYISLSVSLLFNFTSVSVRPLRFFVCLLLVFLTVYILLGKRCKINRRTDDGNRKGFRFVVKKIFFHKQMTTGSSNALAAVCERVCVCRLVLRYGL